MKASTDVTKKVVGQKRDIDYLQDWAGYVKTYVSAKTDAEKAGSSFDDAAVIASIKGKLGIAAIDAELDAAKKA
jgi:hypothetical protein